LKYEKETKFEAENRQNTLRERERVGARGRERGREREKQV
jgi:hypothetical protein